MRTTLLSGFVLLIAVAASQAIVIRHDRDDARYRELAAKYSCVIRVGGATGTLIGDQWIITAAHVAENLSPFSREVEIGGETYPIVETVLHPKWRGQPGPDSVDMALLRLGRPFKGVATPEPYRTSDELGKTVTFVGIGMTGTGKTGPTDDDGDLRAAHNAIDKVEDNWIRFRFDAPPDALDLEGISGPGDSGGPAFIEQNGRLFIAGVSSSNDRGDGTGPCTYGTLEYYARVSPSAGWIDKTMRSPAGPEMAAAVPVDLRTEDWPDTEHAKVAAAFFAAINGTDDAALEQFEKAYRAESALQQSGPAERAKRWRELMNPKGKLTPLRIVQASPTRTNVLVQPAMGERWMEFGFDFESDPPHKMRAVYIDLGVPPKAGMGIAAKAATQTNAELAEKLDEYLSRLAAIGFSGAISVTRGGEVVLEKGYGQADREAGTPFTAETVSTIGSITKQFTGAAIVKLEAMGKLNVNDPISKYFDNVPPDKQGITIHHLLTHSAGIPGGFGGDWDTQATRTWLTNEALSHELLWSPGSRYRYSNAGYSLAAMIVEKASGMDYEAFLQKQLFAPAGMQHTGYVQSSFSPADTAVGYQGGERWGRILEKPMLDDGPCWNLRGNGGVHSTVGDMRRWHEALGGNKILSDASKEKLFAPHMDEGGGDSFYGYGWTNWTTRRGTRLVSHNGGNGILFADFRRYVDEDVMIFMLSNVAEFGAEAITPTIAAIVFGHDYVLPPKIAKVPKATFERAAGSYKFEGGARIDVTVDGEKLRIQPVGRAAWAAISGTSASSPAIDQAYKRMREALDAIKRDDFSVFHTALGGDRPLDAIRDQWKEMIGTLKAYEILETTERSNGIVEMRVRLETEEMPHVLLFEWQGGDIVGIDGVPGSGGTALTAVPIGSDTFKPFALRSSAPDVTFRFDDTGQGKSPTLIVAAGGSEIAVQRAD